MTDVDRDDRARSGGTDLEQRLTALFDQRADSVQRGAVVDLTRAPSASPWRAHRPVAAGIAVAATVAAALTVVGVVADHRHPTTAVPPPSTSRSCSVAPAASFATALPSAAPLTQGGAQTSSHCPVTRSTPGNATATVMAGPRSCTTSSAAVTTLLNSNRQTVDQPINLPRASASAGAFVMQQQRMTTSGRYTHNELAYFDATGHGTTIWIDPTPDMDRGDYDVAVDPDAAASSDWVVFSPSHNRNEDNDLRAWNIHTHRTVTVPHQNQPAGSALVPFAPIVVGDTAYWIEYPTLGSKRETLIGWNLAANRLVSSQNVSGAVRLVRIGTDLGLVVEKDSAGKSVSSLVGRPGHPIPATVTRASTGLIELSSDGRTVRWTSGEGHNPGLVHTWSTDASRVDVQVYATSGAAAILTWPFVQLSGNDARVVDLSTNTVTRLPAHVSIALVTGTTVLITTSTSAQLPDDTVSRVPLSQLTALFCH